MILQYIYAIVRINDSFIIFCEVKLFLFLEKFFNELPFQTGDLQLRPLRYLGLLPDPFRPSDTISDCFRTLLDRWHYFRPTGGSGIPVCLGNINVINLRKKGVKEDSSSFAIHLFSILRIYVLRKDVDKYDDLIISFFVRSQESEETKFIPAIPGIILCGVIPGYSE
ncbi:hypothetical protein RIR_jg28553.t2 [Rhizophagus irregularis DAOM 181602=DAOM 197198]|nr:hypothetical protein RIR_jg28553.t2 [Rhizophagus irregularis DAOM 181602=DAOM 197198]